MFLEIKAPQLGANDEEVKVLEWRCKAALPFDVVKKGDVVATIETSKATYELEAEAKGVFIPKVKKGELVSVNDVIAYIVDSITTYHKRRKEMEKQAKIKTTNIYEEAGLTLTSKAYKLAIENHVKPECLPKGLLIKETDVMAILSRASNNTVDHFPGAAKKVLISHAGNGALTILETINAMGGVEVIGFIDTREERKGQKHGGLPIFMSGDRKSLVKENPGMGFIAAITDRKERLEVMKEALEEGFTLFNAIHPRAYISPSARLGGGNHIKAGAIVDSYSTIGSGCIIDNCAVVAHHNKIGNGVHLAPGVKMGSSITIEDVSLIGIGACINTGVKIGKDVIVTPGSAVTNNVESFTVVGGVPAIKIGVRN